MTRVATMVGPLAVFALLGPPAAGAQDVADACYATQSQLAQKRTELAQARTRVMRLNDAVNTYREGVEFQRQNAADGVLDTILAEAAADAKVVKATADSAIAWMAALAPRPLKPAADAVQKGYEAVTGGIAATYELFDGNIGKATAGWFGAISKGLEGAEAFRATKGLVPTTWEGPGHFDYSTPGSKALGSVEKMVKGVNALKEGDAAEAIGQTIGAIPDAPHVARLVGKGASARSEKATTEDRTALVLEGFADSAKEVKEITRNPALSPVSDMLKAGATTARAEKDAFDGLDKTLEAKDLRNEIRDRATVAEAQFAAKMKVKVREEAQAQAQVNGLELEVATLELQHNACAPRQLFAGPGDSSGSRYSSDRSPAASVGGTTGFFGGAFGSLSPSGRTATGQRVSSLFQIGAVPAGGSGSAAPPMAGKPIPVPTPPPLQGKKPERPVYTGPRESSCHAPGTSGGCQ